MGKEADDLAWAAGFLEGEGSFCIRSNGRWFLGAGQVDREPLERLQALFGGNIYKRERGPGVLADGFNRQAWYGWETSRKDLILSITAAVLPLMTESRRVRIPWSAEAARYITTPKGATT